MAIIAERGESTIADPRSLSWFFEETGLSAQSRGSRGSPGSGVRSRGSDPPFHAPGSQDDVSSQANSLKLEADAVCLGAMVVHTNVRRCRDMGAPQRPK